MKNPPGPRPAGYQLQFLRDLPMTVMREMVMREMVEMSVPAEAEAKPEHRRSHIK